MNLTIDDQSHIASISPKGRFDFNTHKQFREACDIALKANEVREIRINLKSVEYVDSSALGMLLFLREKATAVNKTVTLANCSGTVKQVIDVANLQKLFEIK